MLPRPGDQRGAADKGAPDTHAAKDTRPRAARRTTLRRTTQEDSPGAGAHLRSRPIHPRRAHQPSRPRNGGVARGIPQPRQQEPPHGDPRPLLPRQGMLPHTRTRQPHRLHLQRLLLLLSRETPGAHRRHPGQHTARQQPLPPRTRMDAPPTAGERPQGALPRGGLLRTRKGGQATARGKTSQTQVQQRLHRQQDIRMPVRLETLPTEGHTR